MSKRRKEILSKVDANKIYPFNEAMELLQSFPKVKFNESVEIGLNLGIDPKKSDQVVRGSVLLPNGTGKTVRVAVFTQGAKADEAKEAGADIVGMNDLADDIKAGNMNFDVVIASPDAMGTVGRLGTILGPRGLMPNPKVGTVTPDVATAVKNAKSGQVRFRADKAGILHGGFGKLDFTVEALKENLEAVLAAVKKLKPSTSKGSYFKKLTVSTTMGPGLKVDLSSLTF